jgi:hypothetical protein
MPWKTFIRAHWDTIAAADFFTVEVWTTADRELSDHRTNSPVNLLETGVLAYPRRNRTIQRIRNCSEQLELSNCHLVIRTYTFQTRADDLFLHLG